MGYIKKEGRTLGPPFLYKNLYRLDSNVPRGTIFYNNYTFIFHPEYWN
jgi:heme oxygenase